MVLQHDKPLKIWGWTSPGEKVTVGFIKKKYSTVTAANGNWQIALKPIPKGGPYDMTIAGNNKLEIHDILFGDVKKFVWGTAQISGNQVIVSSDEIADPKYVRYGWANNPDRTNLYNKEGLPASPFEAVVN